MKKYIALALTAMMILGLLGCTAQGGKQYPGDELRIQVPFKTGGALDVQVRTTAKYLAKELGCNVIVENIAGAGGQLGTTKYLEEKENTSTILLTDAWLLTVTPLLGSVEYAKDDYVPIIDHNVTDFCLYANPAKSGIKSYEDLVAFSKSNRVLFGSGGAGTSLYIIEKSLLDVIGAQSDTISQNSTAEGLVNLMAGTVDVSMSSFKDAADYVKSGEIVPILWFGEGKYTDDDAYASGVPSAKDCGIDILYQGFYFYSIRKGTDQKIVDQLYQAFSAVYQNTEFIEERSKIGFAPSGRNTTEIEAYLDEFCAMAKSTFTLE